MFEFISLAVHQVLYYRNLYPKDAFDWGRKYGFDCRLCKYEGKADKTFKFTQAYLGFLRHDRLSTDWKI